MREGIHPKYVECRVNCSGCGSSWNTRSTIAEIRVEVCASCHPFFTGQRKIVDTEGRVEKFMQRYGLKGRK